MATKYLVATGVTSDPANWNDGTLPTASDQCHANGFTGTIDANLSVLGLYTTAGAGAVAGGGFVLSGGVTLSALVIKAGTTICLTHSSGTSYVIGDPQGSDTGAALSSIDAVRNTAGNLYITGNPQCGSNTNNNYTTNPCGARNTNGYMEIIGNPVPVAGNYRCSVYQGGTGSTYIRGRVVGALSGSLNLTAVTEGGALVVDEAQTSATGIPAISPNATVLERMILNTTNAACGGRWAVDATPVIDMYDSGGNVVTLSDAISQGQPAESDVRYGVSYATGTRTGTAHIPPAASVALNVPVDNTVGELDFSIDVAALGNAVGLHLTPQVLATLKI